MKLHLPKMLLTAVLAAATMAPAAWGADQVVYISDAASTGDVVYDSIGTGQYDVGRLLYAQDDTDGKITFSGNIDVYNNTVWVGPGKNGAQNADQSVLVELSGIISNGGTLKLNEYSSKAGGDAVYVLSNTGNTFSGTVHLGHGGGANSYVQLSLTSDSISSAVVELEEKDKVILSVEGNASIVGLKGGKTNATNVTSSGANNTLTLSGSETYEYKGIIGSGNYISRDSFTTSSTADTASSALKISKTGTGTQTLSGTVNLGAVNVSAGTLALTGTSTVQDITVTGGLVKAGGTFTLTGALEVGTSGTFEITKAITNNGSITGTVSITDLSGFTSLGGTYEGGEIEGNGIGSTKYAVLSGTNKNGVSVSYDSGSYTTDTDGNISIGDATLFVINSGSEKTSIVNATAADRVSIVDGAGLVIDSSISDSIIIDSGDSTTFTLNTATDTTPTISTSIAASGANVSVVKDAASATSTLSLGSVNHSIGSLTIKDGVAVSSAYTGANAKGFIDGAVTVEGGGTLELQGKYATGWTTSGKTAQATDSITLTGSSADKVATLKLGSHIVMEVTDIHLNGNTRITCTTGADGATNADYSKGALESYGKSIVVTGTNNVSDAGLHARGSLTLNIADTATFEQAGNVYRGSNQSTITKTGVGEMTFSGEATQMYTYISNAGTTNFNTGTIIDKDLAATGGIINLGAATHTIQCIDTSKGAAAQGTVVLKEKSKVTVTGSIWGVSTASINLEKDAELTFGSATIKGLSSETNQLATLKAIEPETRPAEFGGYQYSIDNENFTLTNGQFTLTSNVGAGYTELNNKLRNVALVNEATGVLIVKHQDADRDIASIEAKNGNVNLTNMQGVETLVSLDIADTMAVGAHTGYNGIDSGATDFGTISVTESLTLGSGAVVNGNLQLGSVEVALTSVTTDSSATGSLAEIQGKLLLTLGDTPSLTLDAKTMQAIEALGEGETLYILKAGEVDWGTSGVAMLADDTAITTSAEIDAALYIDGLKGYNLNYDSTSGLMGVTMSIPEPTTATLSLLALAGLAARRRRR